MIPRSCTNHRPTTAIRRLARPTIILFALFHHPPIIMRPATLVHNPMVARKPIIFNTTPPRFVPGILHIANGHPRCGRIDHGSTTEWRRSKATQKSNVTTNEMSRGTRHARHAGWRALTVPKQCMNFLGLGWDSVMAR
jgi:hypothetical protein